MDNMNFEQLRQMGMAPSRQIDMAPLNIPGVAQPASAPTQGVGNIDTRISELENMFANVHTNRAFSQQEMQDMNQKRQLLDNLYRIRESSQSRAVADEERKQKIEALKNVGEEAKRKQQEAQTAKRNQVPSTYVLEQMGQNPFVSGGYMIDSSGRRIEVPKYGTVTPAMYQKLGQSVIEGKPAPSPSDFIQQTPFSQTQDRIQKATEQGDYGKASILAQQQINNLAQIAAMPGLTDEAKQILNANMVSLANQAKNNAGIYQEQIKAKALVQKAALDNQNKMEIERLKSDPKFQKLDQQTQSTIMKIYSDNFHKEVEVPVWDSTKNKWATTLEGKSVTEKRRIIELSPQQVEYLTGRKISAKDYATENYKAQLQMLGIQPTEAPLPNQNINPQGTQVNAPEEKRNSVLNLYNGLMTDPKNPNVMYDPKAALAWLDTAQGKSYVQSKGLSDNDVKVLKDAILKTTNAKDNSGIEYINRKYQPRNQGAGVSVGKTETKKKAGVSVNKTNTTNNPVAQPTVSLPDNLLRLAMLAENAGMQGHPQSQLTNYMPTGDRQILVENPVANNYVYPQDVIPGSDFVPVNTNTANLPPGIIQLMALLNGKVQNIQ